MAWGHWDVGYGDGVGGDAGSHGCGIWGRRIWEFRDGWTWGRGGPGTNTVTWGHEGVGIRGWSDTGRHRDVGIHGHGDMEIWGQRDVGFGDGGGGCGDMEAWRFGKLGTLPRCRKGTWSSSTGPGAGLSLKKGWSWGEAWSSPRRRRRFSAQGRGQRGTRRVTQRRQERAEPPVTPPSPSLCPQSHPNPFVPTLSPIPSLSKPPPPCPRPISLSPTPPAPCLHVPFTSCPHAPQPRVLPTPCPHPLIPIPRPHPHGPHVPNPTSHPFPVPTPSHPTSPCPHSVPTVTPCPRTHRWPRGAGTSGGFGGSGCGWRGSVHPAGPAAPEGSGDTTKGDTGTSV